MKKKNDFFDNSRCIFPLNSLQRTFINYVSIFKKNINEGEGSRIKITKNIFIMSYLNLYFQDEI